MEIASIQPRQGKLEIEGEITEVSEPRPFNKFGKEGKVANAVLKDNSGSVKLTLWNEQADQVKVGDKIKISNGWSDEYMGELQVSTGRFGSLTVLGKAEERESGKSSTQTDEEDIQY